MSTQLSDEIEAINSIYGQDTIREIIDSTASDHFILAVPQQDITLRLSIPDEYPNAPVQIIAVEGTGPTAKKGFGKHVLFMARDLLKRIFMPGQVCLFDLLQELEQSLEPESTLDREQDAENHGRVEDGNIPYLMGSETTDTEDTALAPPQWAISAPVTEKKSIFIARACAVGSTFEAQSAITHLLSTDKRACKATHNISAYRTRTLINGNEVAYQDCDDDGEAAAGGRLLKLLQMMDVWNVLVIVSRWYGGVQLGPARFGVINAVAREAVVAGRFAKG